ncbi:DUF6262 family protein [Pseudomonas luteola]|uniref:DUF6262 family protein n=1 Tax=Pseudomonas luteola TaxID=47886 RepID=UPI003A87B06A
MASKSTNGRSRPKTADALNRAIDNMLATSEKLTISSVARVTGVTPGLIHNTYPAVAERIRSLMGKSVRAQRDSKHQALIKEKELNKALRADNRQLLEEIARLASINQRLLLELTQLKGIASGSVIELAPRPVAT